MDTKKLDDLRDELFHVNSLSFFLYQNDIAKEELGFDTTSNLRGNPILCVAEIIMEKTASCLKKIDEIEHAILEEKKGVTRRTTENIKL